MSNAILMWSLAYLLLPQVVLAGPLSTVSLSPYLTDKIPKCAQQCVGSYISDNFRTSTCRYKQDLKCLCTSKSISGLTLGEGALSCLASYCSEEVLEERVGLYSLCEGIKSARPMTHGTLTVTHVVPTTVALTSHSSTKTLPHSIGLPRATSSKVPHSTPAHSSSTRSTTSTHHTSSAHSSSATHSSSIHTTTRTPTTKSSSSPISSSVSIAVAPLPTFETHIPSPSTTFIASPASSSAAPKPPRNLTTPQIAGVTVAGVASAALAFGVLFCIFCFRRKDRKTRNSGSSFGGDKIVHTRPGSRNLSTTALVTGAGAETGAEDPERGFGNSTFVIARERNGENRTSRWSFWRRSTKPEEIGLAVGPEMMQTTPPTEHAQVHDEAPASATSYRTTSQLLPEKPIYPTYSLFPHPQTLRVVNPTTSPVSPQSPDSAETRFTDVAGPSTKPAPRGRLSVDTSQRSLQQKPRTVRPSGSDPFLDSHSDPQGLVASGIAGGLAPSPWSQSLHPVRKPVPALRPSGAPNLQPSAAWSKPSLQIPSTYAGRPTYGVPEQSRVPDPTWGSKQRNSFARPTTQCSNASHTSFEDDGEDDEPTNAQPVLSPVAESPKIRSPPGAVRYPKIPGTIPPLSTRRPSPESPTRQPPPRNPKRALAAQATTGKNANIPQPQVAELYGSPVSPKAMWAVQPASTESLTGSASGRRASNAPSAKSAKWQILVQPGLEGGIDGGSSPAREKPSSSPRSGKTGESYVSGGELTPSTPKKDRR